MAMLLAGSTRLLVLVVVYVDHGNWCIRSRLVLAVFPPRDRVHCHIMRLLLLLLLLSAANGMRLQLHLTRRAVLVSPMVVALPQAASAETLRDSAIRLEQDLRANGANKDSYWTDHAPVLSQPAATPTFVTIDLVAPDDSGTEYVWVRKVLPKNPDFISILAVAKIKPGAPARFTANVPAGTYKVALSTSSHGYWESQDIKVRCGPNQAAHTPWRARNHL